MRYTLKYILIICVSVFGLASSVQTGYSEESEYSEFDIKAAFLYNFARFVDWPEDVLEESDSLEICILGPNPFSNSLEDIVEGKTAQGKPIAINYVSELGELLNCQILYITSDSKEQSEAALAMIADRSVLTVSDIPGFASHGGMVGFYLDDGSVRFEVNRKLSSQAGLTFSSRLLNIARLVSEKEH